LCLSVASSRLAQKGCDDAADKQAGTHLFKCLPQGPLPMPLPFLEFQFQSTTPCLTDTAPLVIAVGLGQLQSCLHSFAWLVFYMSYHLENMSFFLHSGPYGKFWYVRGCYPFYRYLSL